MQPFLSHPPPPLPHRLHELSSLEIIVPACGEGLGEEHRSSKPCLGAEGEAGAKSSSADPQNIIGGRPSNNHNNESLILILKVQIHDS